jgi:hypothetical protein
MATELFWVGGNRLLEPNFWSGVKFQNDRDYAADLVVGDNGLTTVRITDVATGALLADFARYTAADFPAASPFPSALTGYFLLSAHDAIRDFTFYVTKLKVIWLP